MHVVWQPVAFEIKDSQDQAFFSDLVSSAFQVYVQGMCAIWFLNVFTFFKVRIMPSISRGVYIQIMIRNPVFLGADWFLLDEIWTLIESAEEE